MKLPVIGQGIGKGGVVSARRAINCYFEQRPGGEKAAFVTRPLPKIIPRATLTRAKSMAYLDDDQAYIDDDGTIRRFFPIGGAVLPSAVGTLPQATEWVRLAAGHDGVVIAGAGVAVYHRIDNNGQLLPVTVPETSLSSVVYHRGWYLYGSGSTLWWSDVSDAIGALDFAGADASRDNIISLIDIGPAVAVMGSRTIEFWASTGSADAVFAPIQEATQRIGIGNPGQAKKLGDAVYFWGMPDSGTAGLHVLEGMRYKRISTEDIEREIGGGLDADWAAIKVDGFSVRGHTFVHVHHLFTQATAMLDVTTGVWTIIPLGAPFSGPAHFIAANGIVFLAVGAMLGEVDVANVDETVERVLITDHITDENFERITMGSVRIDCGGMSEIRMRVSRDGGVTWGAAMTSPVGNASVQQVRFNRLGTARQFTLEISATGGFDIANVITGVAN